MTRPADEEDLENSAESARLSGDEARAVELFTRLIESELSRGRLSKAISAYQKVLVWRPDDVDLHLRLAGEISRTRAGRAQEPARRPAADSVLFEGIDPARLSGILQRFMPRRFAAGMDIVREGEAGDSLFLITRGTVSVVTTGESGEAIPLDRLVEGDFFGEVSLLTSRPRTATVRAEAEVELLELSRESVRELEREFPNIERTLSEYHRRRAEKTVETLLERRRPS
jgi:hypothetical protein